MHKKFTLLELIVVLAIIGLLMTLLLPSLRNAREAARLAVCMGNMHSVSTGMQMFSKDEDHIIAHNYAANRFDAMDWPKGVDQYLGGTAPLYSNNFHFRQRGGAEVFWGCPSTYKIGPGNLNNTVYSIDYGIVGGGTERSYLGYKRMIIDKPAESVLLVDTVNSDSGRVSFRTAQDQHYNKRSGLTDSNYKHIDKKIPLAFFDGHIKSTVWIPRMEFIDTYLEELYNLPDKGFGNETITY